MKKVFLFLLLIININTASLQELDKITGIGPKYAQAIIDARPFSSVDDLLKVKGIGPKTLQKIKDQGLACVDCELTPKQEETRPPENLHADLVEVGPLPAPQNYPGGVFINEILPSPEGADETEEWIELYNSNNFEVDLSSWKIEDTAGTKTSFLINPSANSGPAKILANNFLIFKRPETKILLNNDGDGLNLLTPDKKTEDSISFTKAPLGQSYNKTSSGWAWSKTLTPGSANIIALPKTENSDNNNLTASINDAINPVKNSVSNGASPWFLFFTALALTIISAVAVLFVRLKFKNYKNLKI